jgi:hypothetical protein
MFDKIVSAAISVVGSSFFKGDADSSDYTPSDVYFAQAREALSRSKARTLATAGQTKAYEAVDYKDLVRQWETYLTTYQQMRGKR